MANITNNIANTEIVNNSGTLIRVGTLDGYIFNGNVTFKVNGVNTTSTPISANRLVRLERSLTASDNVIISGNTIAATPSLNISVDGQSLDGITTMNFDNFSFSYQNQTITLTPLNGLSITSANGTGYTTNNITQTTTQLNFTVQNGIATCNVSNFVNSLRFTFTAQTARNLTFTENLQNCSVSGAPSVINIKSNLNLTVTASNNYEFNTPPQLVFNEYIQDGNGYVTNTKNFTVANNRLTATLQLNLSECNLSYLGNNCTALTINANAAEIPPETVNITTTEDNCIIEGIPQIVYTNTVLNLTATASNNYEFNTPPQLSYTDKNGYIQAYNFTIASNKLTATLQLDLGTLDLTDVSTIFINADADAVTPQIEKYGTINVYKVTENDLKEFAKQRFFRIENTQQSYFQMIDLGNFVHSIKRLYCNIENTTAETLKCGNYDTSINVQTPLNDNIVLDCGTVTIPYKNNDNTDFNSDIKLFLPFYGFYNLSSEFVGKTIAVKYIVNIVTTNTIIKITYENIVIDCLECNIANDIVYKTNAENFNNTPDFNLQILKGLTPYAVLKYYNSENNQIYNNDCVRDTISNFNGYIECTEITNFNNDTITDTEKDMLLNELRNGVIIENV